MLGETCVRQPLILNHLPLQSIALLVLLPNCWEPEEWFKEKLTGLQMLVIANDRDNLSDFDMM